MNGTHDPISNQLVLPVSLFYLRELWSVLVKHRLFRGTKSQVIECKTWASESEAKGFPLSILCANVKSKKPS